MHFRPGPDARTALRLSVLVSALALGPAPLLSQLGAQTPAPQTPEVPRTEAESTPGLASEDPEKLIDEELFGDFLRLKKSKQIEALERITEAVWAIDHPTVAGLRPFVGSESAEDAPRIRNHRPGRDFDATWVMDLPFPVQEVYRFGFGTIERVDGHKSASSGDAKQDRVAEVRAILDGQFPQADRVLAGMLQSMDESRTVDGFLAFLARWRDEERGISFFEALDRTAGTPDSVFHFDAMLAEWTKFFVPKDHQDGQRIRSGPGEAQTAFHKSFRNVRLYRQLREVVALTILLGPEFPLPDHLSDYESNASGDQFSSRACIEVLSVAERGDPVAVIRDLHDATPPFPEHPWTEDYVAIEALNQAYADADERVIAAGESTSEALDRWRRDRRDLRRAISKTASDVLRSVLSD